MPNSYDDTLQVRSFRHATQDAPDDAPLVVVNADGSEQTVTDINWHPEDGTVHIVTS